MSKFSVLIAACGSSAAARAFELRVQLAQAAAARDVAQQSMAGMSGFAKDAVLDMRSVFNAGARVMAAVEAKQDGGAEDVVALHARAKTVAQHYKTFARRGDHRM
jgi:succinate dehydrogenase/fumarate reductase-like Fe-S protein